MFQALNSNSFKGDLVERANKSNIATIYTTLQEALENNFALTEVTYPTQVEPRTKEAIEILLKRNQLIITAVNAIEKSGKPGTFFSGPKAQAQQALFEAAVNLKQRAYSLQSEEEKAAFFQDILRVSQAHWTKTLNIKPDLLDTPVEVLNKFFNNLPEKVQSKRNQEKWMIGKVLSVIKIARCETNWEKIINIVNTEIVTPSAQLNPLMDYLNYRKILGISGEQTLPMPDSSEGKGLN